MADPGMTAGQGARPGEDAAGSAEGGREAGRETRPLVTFALFAYNQEAFIREAVEGAFAQTYSPLEIILSDDCSSDRTFQIMQDMAAAYRGPHRVVVRRTDRNLRPYSHVLDVAKIAKGDIVILAAGDDLSKPDRAAFIVASSQESDAWAFHSRFDMIDENGKVLSTSQRAESLFSPDSEFNRYFHSEDGPVYVVHGATSAYRKKLLDIAPSDSSGILSEDGVFTLLLNMAGKKATFVDASLVQYRTHLEAISNARFDTKKITIRGCQEILKKQMLYSKNIADRARLALDFYHRSAMDLRKLNEDYLLDEIVIQTAKHGWKDLGFSARSHALRVALKQHRLGYLLPSILGPRLGPRYLYIRYWFAR